MFLSSQEAKCDPRRVQHATWRGVEKISKKADIFGGEMWKDVSIYMYVQNTIDYAESSSVNNINNKAFPV